MLSKASGTAIIMCLQSTVQALQDAQAEKSPQLFAATPVSMPNSVSVNSVNLIGTTTAGQGLWSTAPADLNDTFVPANFLGEILCEENSQYCYADH